MWISIFLGLFLVGGILFSFGKRMIEEERHKAGKDKPGEVFEPLPSFKEEKLKGTSVLKMEEKPEDEKSLFEKVYSGKAPQAKYARHIANRTREMSREMAEQAELENKRD